jgi:hypothetical protein
MLRSEKLAAGFATIALENHWSPWFRKRQMEKLGFKPVDSIKVSHKTKHKGRVFSIYLIWIPKTDKEKPPVWDKQMLLEGETFCLAHPLYRPQAWKGNLFESEQKTNDTTEPFFRMFLLEKSSSILILEIQIGPKII